MSKISKRILHITEGLTVNFKEEENSIFFKGIKGETKLVIPNFIKVNIENNLITTSGSIENTPMIGTFNSLINNCLIGIKEGYVVKLEIKGNNCKIEKNDKKLTLYLGKSHVDYLEIPERLSVTLNTNKLITIEGIDKHEVTSFAAKIRSFRKPGVYQYKGVYYLDEKVKLKVKKGVNK